MTAAARYLARSGVGQRWAALQDQMSLERIGLHIIGGTSLALAGAGKPRIVKLCDCSPEYKAQVRAQVGPDCLIVVRWVEPRQDLAAPEAEAEAWFARHEAQMRRMSDANAIYEGYNEIPDSMAGQFARFEMRRLALMHAAGLRAGVGSWSVGVPDLPTWQLYRPILAAMGSGDVVCLHEYWTDGSDIGNHWLTARFAHVAVAPYLAGKQIAITECGRDHVAGRGAAGWQRTCDAVTFLDELRAYDALLARYPQVIGATVFTVGGSGWEAFDPSPVWPRVVSQYQAESAQPPAPVEEVTPVTLSINGSLLDVARFRLHVQGIDLRGMQRVVIHHTAAPDEATWAKHGGWEYWKTALKRYYESKGWDRGPHLFVSDEGIGLFTSLDEDGRAVGGGALEVGCRHIEIVGNYTDHWPSGATLDNAVAAAAALLNARDLPITALTNHAAITDGGSECPGAALRGAWSWFVEEVEAARMEQSVPVDLEALLGDAAQAHVLPLNPVAAFEKAAAQRGFLPASREFDVTVAGVTYRAQAYRDPGARGWQHIVYCVLGDWGNLRWFDRLN